RSEGPPINLSFSDELSWFSPKSSSKTMEPHLNPKYHPEVLRFAQDDRSLSIPSACSGDLVVFICSWLLLLSVSFFCLFDVLLYLLGIRHFELGVMGLVCAAGIWVWLRSSGLGSVTAVCGIGDS